MKIRNLLNVTTRGLFANSKLSPLPISQSTKIAQHTNFIHSEIPCLSLAANTGAIITSNKTALFSRPSLESHARYFSSSTPFSCESILDEIAKQINPEDNQPFKKVMIVAVQHILGTTVEMFKVLKKLGLKRAIIGGKSYSTHPDSAKALENLGYTFIEAPEQLGYGNYSDCMRETVGNIWNKALASMQESPADLLIILDDGGDLLVSTPGKLFNGISYKPKKVIGIEQTRGGSNHRYFKSVPFPIINVAGSYVKTTIEYPWVADIVAEQVIKKVREKAGTAFSHKPIIGVIGNGTMGKAIVNKFIKKGHCVLVHDIRNKIKDKNVILYSDITLLIREADIIIGCTGTDITLELSILNTLLGSIRRKYLVSTSSKDLEFNNLLVYIQERTKQLERTPNPFVDIEYCNPNNPANSKLVILRGGFPINFDNKEHSVPPEKIWPTRAALMSACLMAVQAYHKGVLKTADILKLDPYVQKLILQKYITINPNDPITKKLPASNLEQFIAKHSDGHGLELSFKIDEDIHDNQKSSITIHQRKP